MTAILLFAVLAVSAAALAQEPATITQDELVRRTQLLYDSVASGTKAPWDQYLAPDVIIHDEKGAGYNKTTFLLTVEPLPAGYTGVIKLVHPETLFAPNFAIFSYDLDEVETVFGNRMTARYHQIDTWLYRDHLWRIAASQVMRYYEDPAAITLSAAQLKEYAGTYELAPGNRVVISTHDGKLFSKRGTAAPVEMFAEAPDLFFRKGVEGRRLFRRDATGKVDALIDRRNNEDMVLRRVE